MDEKIKKWGMIAGVALLLVAGVLAWIWYDSLPGKYDDFAKCLKDKGAIFYGAFWCPHCQNEKAFFGRSKKYLPYVECSTPDSNGQLEVCNKAGIQGYPTWHFADGSKQEGEMSLQQLANKTKCQLPQ